MASYPQDPRVIETADVTGLRSLSVKRVKGEWVANVTLALRTDEGKFVNLEELQERFRPSALFLTDGMNPRLLLVEPAPPIADVAAEPPAEPQVLAEPAVPSEPEPLAEKSTAKK